MKIKKIIINPFIENLNNTLIKFPDFDKLILLEKKNLIELISIHTGKNLTFIKSIFLQQNFPFGNQLIIIYKTIFYCQILGCKKIFLDKNNMWYIKNLIINKKYKMIIKSKNRNSINYFNSIIDRTTNFFGYSKYISPVFRVDLFKKEIIKNLPKIEINYYDLFIYIRSGDIFINPNPHYKQPPLCFYKKVLDNSKFNKIYLIAENKNNPVINELLKDYPNIIYNYNPIKIDISYLINAYNMVGGSISTFLERIIELNNNLLFLWTFRFNIIPFNIFYNYKVNNNKIKIFLLYESNDYIQKMTFWNNTQIQRDLMIKTNCKNPFILFNKLTYSEEFDPAKKSLVQT